MGSIRLRLTGWKFNINGINMSGINITVNIDEINITINVNGININGIIINEITIAINVHIKGIIINGINGEDAGIFKIWAFHLFRIFRINININMINRTINNIHLINITSLQSITLY